EHGGVLDLPEERGEDGRQLVGHLPYPEPDEAEGGALVEDHHEDDAGADDGDVNVVPLPLVEEDRELLLPDQLREAAGRGDVAGGERSERRGVEAVGLAGSRDELAVLVDQEDDLRIGLPAELLDEGVDLLELTLVHDERGTSHARAFSGTGG